MGKTLSKKKNGKIELMRFIFCIGVILFHCGNELDIKMPEGYTFFSEGKLGVEFFFIVSGYLLAKHARRFYGSRNNLAKETLKFEYGKFLNILPWHVIIFICLFIMYFAVKTFDNLNEVFMRIIEMLPGFFFIQKTGVDSFDLIKSEWYIAVMLLDMAVIYPLVLKYRDKFTRVVCPIIMVLGIGYMIHDDDQLAGVANYVFSDTLPKVYFRGFVELCTGVFCFEIAERIKTLKLNVFERLILTLIEAGCYVFSLIYFCLDWPSEYEAPVFYMLAAAVTLSFSEITFFNKILKNRFVYYLGHLSLPLYYCQEIGLFFIRYDLFKKLPEQRQVIYCVAITFACALIIDPLSKLFMKLYNLKVSDIKRKKSEQKAI